MISATLLVLVALCNAAYVYDVAINLEPNGMSFRGTAIIAPSTVDLGDMHAFVKKPSTPLSLSLDMANNPMKKVFKLHSFEIDENKPDAEEPDTITLDVASQVSNDLFMNGGALRVTLGPALNVHSIKIKMPVEGTTVDDGYAHWRKIKSFFRKVGRGVYEIFPRELGVDLTSALVKVKYNGKITQITQEMEERDVQRLLWRGGIWHTNKVFGGMSAGIAGRLGHLSRLMPVMRIPREDRPYDAEGAQAPVTKFDIKITHLATHKLFGRMGMVIPKIQSSTFLGDTYAESHLVVDGLYANHPINAGWLLIPSDEMPEHTDSQTRTVFAFNCVDHRDVISTEALDAAGQVFNAIAGVDKLHHVTMFHDPRLATALRDALPRGFVALTGIDEESVALAAAIASVRSLNIITRKRRISPWLAQSMAVFMSGRTPRSVKFEELLDRLFDLTTALDDMPHLSSELSFVGAAVLAMINKRYRGSIETVALSDSPPLTSVELARRIDELHPDAEISAAAFIQSWAENPSLPVLVVDVCEGELVLDQMAFQPQEKQFRWYIPVTLYGEHGEIFNGVVSRRTHIAIPDEMIKPINHYRIDGPYRVHYTREAVESGIFDFTPSDAPIVINDAFALAVNRRISIDTLTTVVHAVTLHADRLDPEPKLQYWKSLRDHVNAMYVSLAHVHQPVRERVRHFAVEVANMAHRHDSASALRLDRDEDEACEHEPLTGETEQVLDWFGYGPNESDPSLIELRRVLLEMRVQAGVASAVDAADRMYQATRTNTEWAEKDKYLRDILDHAALLYGGIEECVEVTLAAPLKANPNLYNYREIVRTQILEAMENPYLTAYNVVYYPIFLLYSLLNFAFWRLDVFSWMLFTIWLRTTYPVSVKFIEPYSVPVKAYFGDAAHKFVCIAYSDTDDKAKVAYIAYQLTLFVWTGLQSTAISEIQKYITHAIKAYRITQRPRDQWITRVSERTDPVLWAVGTVDYDKGTFERKTTFPPRLLHALCGDALRRSADELYELDDDMREAEYTPPKRQTKIDYSDYPDGVAVDLSDLS